jgi:hypothetical protein
MLTLLFSLKELLPSLLLAGRIRVNFGVPMRLSPQHAPLVLIPAFCEIGRNEAKKGHLEVRLPTLKLSGVCKREKDADRIALQFGT